MLGVALGFQAALTFASFSLTWSPGQGSAQSFTLTALLTLAVGVIAPRFDLRTLMLGGACLMTLTGLAFPNVEHVALVAFVATVARRKPDPMPFVHACAEVGVPCASALVVGDSANDAIGARAAGCRVLCVPYGYREGVSAEALGADAVAADFSAAASWIAALRSDR